MNSDWESALASLPRDRRSVDAVVARCAGIDGIAAVLLIGSLAAGLADAVSDVDVLLVVEDERFEEAWQRRQQLHGASLRAWDVGPRGSAGAHKWLSQDLVLTECLIAEPGAVRLAEPFLMLVGDEAAAGSLPRRAPIAREVEAGGFVGDPVELLYDALKFSVRGDVAAARRALQLLDEARWFAAPRHSSLPD